MKKFALQMNKSFMLYCSCGNNVQKIQLSVVDLRVRPRCAAQRPGAESFLRLHWRSLPAASQSIPEIDRKRPTFAAKSRASRQINLVSWAMAVKWESPYPPRLRLEISPNTSNSKWILAISNRFRVLGSIAINMAGTVNTSKGGYLS